jgi:hypothetical protein
VKNKFEPDRNNVSIKQKKVFLFIFIASDCGNLYHLLAQEMRADHQSLVINSSSSLKETS